LPLGTSSNGDQPNGVICGEKVSFLEKPPTQCKENNISQCIFEVLHCTVLSTFGRMCAVMDRDGLDLPKTRRFAARSRLAASENREGWRNRKVGAVGFTRAEKI
jgi:hypothetical protein